MSDDPPSAAIIIPAHNESKYIRSLLESIDRYGPRGCHVVVVDNGSTDGTAEIAATCGATLVHSESRVFPSVARNLGVARADRRAELLVFLDADVELTSEWRDQWARASVELESDPMQITGGTCDVAKVPSWIERVWFLPMRDRKRTDLDGANLITTRKLFQEIGGFDETLETAEDVDICARARKHGARIVLNNEFRVHHEGYPKTLGHFIRRERWHGKGALASINHALASPVTLATAAFAALHLLVLASFAAALWGKVSYFVPLTCVALTLSLCLASVLKKFPHQSLSALPQTLFIMYVYYVGRSLCIWDAILHTRLPQTKPATTVRSHR
jgi:GT2 family glycosyltransferase